MKRKNIVVIESETAPDDKYAIWKNGDKIKRVIGDEWTCVAESPFRDNVGRKYAYWDLTLLPEDFEFIDRGSDYSYLFKGAHNLNQRVDLIKNINIAFVSKRSFVEMFAGTDATDLVTPKIVEQNLKHGIIDMESMFAGASSKTIFLNDNWATAMFVPKLMRRLCANCENLISFTLAKYTPFVYIMSWEGMFENCYNLESIGQSGNMPSLSRMYIDECQTSDRAVFKNCYKLSNYPSKIFIMIDSDQYSDYEADASEMFYLTGSKAATKNALEIKLPYIRTANWCFYGANFSALTFSAALERLLYANHFCDSVIGLKSHPNITSKIKEADYAFQNCTELTAGIDWDFSDLETAKGMYKGCTNLLTCTKSAIGDYDTPHLRDISEMFSGCTKLIQIPAFDCTYVQDATDVVKDCTSLQLLNQGGFRNIHCDLDLSTATAITAESLVNLMAVLGTVDGKTLTLGDTNKAKLTDEQITVATNKGWIVA